MSSLFVRKSRLLSVLVWTVLIIPSFILAEVKMAPDRPNKPPTRPTHSDGKKDDQAKVQRPVLSELDARQIARDSEFKTLVEPILRAWVEIQDESKKASASKLKTIDPIKSESALQDNSNNKKEDVPDLEMLSTLMDKLMKEQEGKLDKAIKNLEEAHHKAMHNLYLMPEVRKPFKNNLEKKREKALATIRDKIWDLTAPIIYKGQQIDKATSIKVQLLTGFAESITTSKDEETIEAFLSLSLLVEPTKDAKKGTK